MKDEQGKNVLPKNWELKRLGEVCLKVEQVRRKEKNQDEELLYLDIGGVDNASNKIVSHKTYKWSDAPSRAQQIVHKGDILFSTVRTYLKNIAQVENEIYNGQIGSSGFCVIRANEEMNPKFLFYLSISENFLRPLNELQTGSSYPAVRDKDVFNQLVPKPPKEVQQQIVSKIEELFSELDKGIEELKTAQQQLNVYRQAVLKWAFEGKLTNEDVKDGELPEGWKWNKVSEIAKVETGTTPPKSNPAFYGNDYPFYKPTDLEAGENVSASTDGLTKLGIDAARFVPEGSTLVTCIGATIGKTGFIKKGGGFNQQINAIVPLKNIYPKFIYYQTVGLGFQKQIIENASATTLPIINKGKFQVLKMVVCSFEEQQQIVQEIESRLSVCDKIEETITDSLKQAEALRQSILKKAFEGRLR